MQLCIILDNSNLEMRHLASVFKIAGLQTFCSSNILDKKIHIDSVLCSLCVNRLAEGDWRRETDRLLNHFGPDVTTQTRHCALISESPTVGFSTVWTELGCSLHCPSSHRTEVPTCCSVLTRWRRANILGWCIFINIRTKKQQQWSCAFRDAALQTLVAPSERLTSCCLFYGLQPLCPFWPLTPDNYDKVLMHSRRSFISGTVLWKPWRWDGWLLVLKYQKPNSPHPKSPKSTLSIIRMLPFNFSKFATINVPECIDFLPQ